MTNRILAFVLLCSALTVAWWFGLDWMQHSYGAVKYAEGYLNDPTGDIVRLGPPVVMNLLAALAVGLFGMNTSSAGKLGALLWSGASPYFMMLAETTFTCAIGSALGNHGICL